MKRWMPHLIIALVAGTLGWWVSGIAHRAPAAGEGKQALFYQSPMHPWVKSDRPGQCTVCGMDLVPIYRNGESFDRAKPDLVMLPPGSPNVVGVETALVKKDRLARILKVAGVIGEDESRHGVISAPVEGRLDGLAMNCEGQPVGRRQPIGTIFSRTLLGAARDYQQALAQGGPGLEAARHRLEQYGLIAEQIQAIPQRQPDDLYFGLVAPLGGTIVKSYVNEGQYVKEGERLFEIADFTQMWCLFTVYEPDLPLVKPRQVVRVRIPSLPGETFNARVGFVSPNLDESTRTGKVRVVLENPENRIRNQSSATGEIELDAPEVLAVPRGAVLWPGSGPRVYVEVGTGAYEARPVKLGRSGDDAWEILEGLAEGDRLVTSGTMLIDGQAQLNRVAHPAQP